MDPQFIGAAMEAACNPEASDRVEAYAIGLALSHEIGRPLCEYRIDKPVFNHPHRRRAYRFAIGDDVVEIHAGGNGPVRMIGARPDDYVWVLIEPGASNTASVRVNLAGSFDDLDGDYADSRTERLYFVDIPQFIDTAIRDLVALRQEQVVAA